MVIFLHKTAELKKSNMNATDGAWRTADHVIIILRQLISFSGKYGPKTFQRFERKLKVKFQVELAKTGFAIRRKPVVRSCFRGFTPIQTRQLESMSIQYQRRYRMRRKRRREREKRVGGTRGGGGGGAGLERGIIALKPALLVWDAVIIVSFFV